jgi:site-specific DNA-methyltransferase (adenine-specific)
VLTSSVSFRSSRKKMRPATKATVHLGDCLGVMRDMAAASVDLAYIDPPFFTQKVHQLHTRDRTRVFSFEDLWSSQKEYANFLFDRLRELHRLLSAKGSLFFHCDRNATHVTRALLDDIFGQYNFRSEIIWHYRRWSNAHRGLLPAHQTIYYYTKSADFTFNPKWVEYSPATNVDQLLQRRKRDQFNKSVYERDEKGNVIPNGRKAGVPLSDVWDIPYLNPKARERTGYPTQKPILLLERIILLVTDEGDTVIDPFCGSGTTLVAAHLLNRSALGIDISGDAVEVTKARLAEPTKTDSLLLAIGRESYRNADEDALGLLEELDCVPVQRNSGIDALLREDLDGTPVPIRVQRHGETIIEAAQKLHRASASNGAKVMFLVVLAKEGCFEFAEELPPGIVAIEAPAIGIREHISRLKMSAR